MIKVIETFFIHKMDFPLNVCPFYGYPSSWTDQVEILNWPQNYQANLISVFALIIIDVYWTHSHNITQT